MQMCFVAISLLLNFPSTTIMIHLTFIWGGKVKDFGGKHWSRKQKIWKHIFVLFDPIFFLYYIICCWSVDYFLFILFVFFIFRRMVQDYRVTQINLYGPVETFFYLPEASNCLRWLSSVSFPTVISLICRSFVFAPTHAELFIFTIQ